MVILLSHFPEKQVTSGNNYCVFCDKSRDFPLIKLDSSELRVVSGEVNTGFIMLYGRPWGMLIGVVFLNETFELRVMAGCVSVSTGMQLANTKKINTEKDLSAEFELAT